jgi:hypothetical protein
MVAAATGYRIAQTDKAADVAHFKDTNVPVAMLPIGTPRGK